MQLTKYTKRAVGQAIAVGASLGVVVYAILRMSLAQSWGVLLAVLGFLTYNAISWLLGVDVPPDLKHVRWAKTIAWITAVLSLGVAITAAVLLRAAPWDWVCAGYSIVMVVLGHVAIARRCKVAP